MAYIISSGQSSNGIILENDSMTVLDGGTGNNTIVDSFGRLYVSSGGTVKSTTVNNDGCLTVSSGGTANSTTVTSGGSLRIDEGGTATNVSWTPCVGKVGYEDGAKVTFASSYSGVYFGFDNRLLSHAAVLNDQTVSGWGCNMYVMSGGTANRATIDDGGWLQVYSGGTANSATIKCGYLDVFSGGVANNVTINNSDSYSILDICSGGTANSVTVNDGGWLDLESGGGVNSATVTSGGSLRIFGGRLTGQTTISSGGYVYIDIDSGAKLDFDISNLAPGVTARINDLSLLSGWTGAVFTLTVDGNQTNGTYRLAGNAAEFNKTISVVNASCTELGTLAVGQTASIGGVYYTLKLNSGNLTVEVSGGSPEPGPVLVPEKLPSFTGDFIGNGKSMLAVKDGNAIRIYRNKGTVLSELTLDDGWAVAGVGDFDCDGADDILRVHASGLVIGEMSDGDGEFSPQVLNFRSDEWSILGTGDFNGNGTDDVLIANPTGASDTVGLLGYWESGVTWTLINGYSAEWKCVATGDFNGDGKCDMLWRNSFTGDGGGTYNAYCTWIVDPPAGQSDWRMVSVANPSEWNFLCSGDFDGNGSHDIAMINGEGVVGIWGVNDGYLNSWSILSAVDPSAWGLAGVGDFNGDGTDDIAWSNTETGLTGYWQINDKELTTWANLAMIG